LEHEGLGDKNEEISERMHWEAGDLLEDQLREGRSLHKFGKGLVNKSSSKKDPIQRSALIDIMYLMARTLQKSR